MAQTRKNRILPLIFVLVCAAVMLRSAFTGLEIDEEYALSLGYRLVSGDRLFYDMWEPHQLSSLPAAALLAMFIGITGGTTGVLVFFRLVVLACKAGMSCVFYREFRRDLGKPAALLAALVLFAFVPKWFLGPDYTGQQFHWTLAASLCLHHYVTRGCKQLWLVPLGAVCACFGYLAFPQSAAAFAVLWIGMLILGKRYGEPKHRGAWVLLGSCAVCGVAFLVYALSGVEFSISLLLSRLTLILHDPQYNFTTAQRMALLAGQALTVARSLLWPLLASAAVCAALYLIKKQPVTVGRLLNLWAAFATVQCLLRAVKDGSLDERQFVPVVVLAGAWAFWRGRGRPGNAELFWLGYLPGLAAYAMILRSTLLGLAPTFMYLTWPAVCGMLALVNHADGGDNAAKSRRAEGVLCLAAMLAFLLVCRVWCVQTTGWKSADITDTPLVRITTGPAKGIYADAKAADMQECLYEALAPYAGQPILQAIGEQHGLGFLMANGTLDVAQASVISGTDSDPRFEQYYTDVPGKTPRVILYDDAEVRDMAEFHAWIEANFNIVDRYTVTHGSASLQVLLVG